MWTVSSGVFSDFFSGMPGKGALDLGLWPQCPSRRSNEGEDKGLDKPSEACTWLRSISQNDLLGLFFFGGAGFGLVCFVF